MNELTEKKLTVVIPAFNEEEVIGTVLDNLTKKCSDVVKEIIVIDDGSSDNTANIAKGMGVCVIQHKRNKGYGASLKTGILSAKTEFVVTMDADGQHSPEDIIELYKIAYEVDMVAGWRNNLIHSKLWRMPGKWLLGIMANYLSMQNIPDLNCGLRIIRRDTLLKYLHLCPQGFSFSTTILMAFINRGYNVAFTPIKISKRVGKSTVSIRTGLETIILILRLAALFNPLRIFLPASFIFGTLGILWGLPYIIAGHGVSVGAMLSIVTAIMLFTLGLTCDQISQLRLERYE